MFRNTCRNRYVLGEKDCIVGFGKNLSPTVSSTPITTFLGMPLVLLYHQYPIQVGSMD